ncbi:MAG: hypothetical protein JXB39_16275 [Deltaproteobacteria bacterium]|nr:hypothetical protein [Deltaproteobacteria bacterium]
MVLLLACLAGCPAERLGVELPPGGLQALSVEDLQRDVFLVVSARDGAAGARPQDVADRIERRLVSMHTLPAFGESYRQSVPGGANVCGRRDGFPGRGGTLVAALDAGAGADAGASAVAALVSLAKATDAREPPVRTQVFCRVAPGGEARLASDPPVPWKDLDRVLVLGPLGGRTLEVTRQERFGQPVLFATTGPEPWHGQPEDGAERIDYRVLLEHVKTLADRFEPDPDEPEVPAIVEPGAPDPAEVTPPVDTPSSEAPPARTLPPEPPRLVLPGREDAPPGPRPPVLPVDRPPPQTPPGSQSR